MKNRGTNNFKWCLVAWILALFMLAQPLLTAGQQIVYAAEQETAAAASSEETFASSEAADLTAGIPTGVSASVPSVSETAEAVNEQESAEVTSAPASDETEAVTDETEAAVSADSEETSEASAAAALPPEGSAAAGSRILEAKYIDASHKTVLITAACGPKAGIPLSGTKLLVSELLPGDKGYDEYIEQSIARIGADVEEIGFLRAFDIKIVDENDESIVYEPAGDVAVKITFDNSTLDEWTNVDVLHFVEDETTDSVAVVEMDTTVKGEAVQFTTDSFSVYTVIGHEGGVVETPRVIFHFIAPNAAETGSGSSAYYVGNPYSFTNKASDTQTTQILENGEALELIADPTNQSDKYFYGWYVVQPRVVSGTTDEYGIGTSDGKLYFTWPAMPDTVAFETAISITESNVNIGDTVHWRLNGASGSGTVDKNGNVHVFAAPMFEKYNFVNFMLYARDTGLSGANSLMTRKLIAMGSASSAEIKVSDIRSTSKDSVHLVFTGWEYKDENDQWVQVQTVDHTGAEIKDPGRDGVYITVNLADTESIDLYPIFVEARWVDFYSGVSGSGASYVSSRFLESWGTATPPGTPEVAGENIFTSLETSSRKGYAFEGWYAFAVTDPTTGEITNLDTPADVEIKYIDVNTMAIQTVTVNTTAKKVANGDGSIAYTGTCSIKDNGGGTYSIADDGSGSINLFGAGSTSGSLKFYDPLDKLHLAANWTPDESQIAVVYWTENADDDSYIASAVKTITTTDLNSQLGTSYASGSTITLTGLQQYKETIGSNQVGILDTAILDDVGAVPAGEEIFYDLNTSNPIGTDGSGNPVYPETSQVINGDGSTIFNVYYSRKVFKLVFHIGRDKYVKLGGRQSSDEGWDGNWIQFMFNDPKVTELGYTGTGSSQYGVFKMTYLPDNKTYTSEYVTTNDNVMGDYIPQDNENVYVIEAKYGAYIGDKWPTPVNPNFRFTDSGTTYTMYTWAAYYGSRYCKIANDRQTWGGQQGSNPDLNGIYEYMSAELCSNRDGTALINDAQVHHIVAYFGRTSNQDRYKQYHVLYEAIDGTYDPDSVTLVSGSDYTSYTPTTWSTDIAHATASVIDGKTFYEVSVSEVISNVNPQFQMAWEFDGYEYFYSCYNVPQQYENHVYFFYTPKQYTLLFKYEDESDWKTDSYYYTQSLADANKYPDPEKEGYYFAGWYTNAAGVGEPFDFANEAMPAASVVLYPILKVLQYTIKIDPNGGIIDHINYDYPDYYGITANDYGVNGSGYDSSQATYFTADYGTTVGEYSIDRTYIELTENELDPSNAAYYTGTKYYYINTQFNGIYDGDWGLPPNLRNAVYMEESQLRCYYNFYKAVATANLGYYTGVTVLPTFDDFAAAYTSYPSQAYRPVNPASEHYTFTGWYLVDGSGSVSSMPYNFNDPIKGDIELRAMWRLDGGYYVEYDPYFFSEDDQGQVTAIIGELQQWNDPADPSSQLYADQTPTLILRAPTNVTPGWIFRGWRVVAANGTKTYTDPNTGAVTTYTDWKPIQFDANGDVIYYQPGDPFTIDSALVSEIALYGSIIHMQAYYESEENSARRPEITNLVLDANDPFGGYVNTTDSSALPSLDGPGTESINTTDHLDTSNRPTQILFGDIQSNLALHLYRYATTKEFNGVTGTQFFTNSNGYLLIGFDEGSDLNNAYNESSQPDGLRSGQPFVPTYAVDSVAAVTRSETNKVLYAVWEPMVYVSFVNTTAQDITIDLTGSGTGTVSIVNTVTGEFDREQTTSTITVPAKSGNTNGTVKIVLPGAAAGTDSITATAVNDHIRTKMSVSGEFPAGTAYGTGSADIQYGDAVTYTGTLQTDPEGIIVTYTEEVLREVVFDVNGGTWTETSPLYHSLGSDLYDIYEEDITDNAYQPSDPTRSGKVFLGWTTNADIAGQTDFSSTSAVTWGSTTITPDAGSNVLDKVKSDYLWDFSQEPPYDHILYAVWSDAVTVTFNMTYTNQQTLHNWSGPATTATEGNYVFYRSSATAPYVTYKLAKGDKVPKPDDPTPHSTIATWHFMKWLISNSTTDNYRRTAKPPNDKALTTYGFDFSQPVMFDTTLVTSWTKNLPQVYNFTVENQVITGRAGDEFEYTIAVSDVNLNQRSRVVEPTANWGSVTTKLKDNEQYTVRVTVSYISDWGGAYSVEIEVIDRDGVLVKSGKVLIYDGQTYSGFTTEFKYTLTISQEEKSGYETTVDAPNPGTVDCSTNDTTRSFTFTSKKGTQSAFTPITNDYVGGETNSLKVIFTNRGSYIAPTEIVMSSQPFALMIFAGLLPAAALILPFCAKKRRRKDEED